MNSKLSEYTVNFIQWKMWFLLNYKYEVGEKTFVDDIVKHSVSEQENIPWYSNSRALTPELLGCIVNDIWNDGAVKRNLVGPRKNRRLVLNNLVRQEAEDLDQPPSGWSLICDGTKRGSLVRLEDWEFQNRRVSTEIKYEHKNGRTSYELHSTGRSLDIDELYLGLDTTNPTRMLPDLYRLSTLFDCTKLCAGINTHSNVMTKVPHQVGKVTDCTNMAEETRMFSNDCCLLMNHTGTNHCSMCTKLLRVENQCHKRKRNMDTTNSSCNKKYLTKNELQIQVEKAQYDRKKAMMREKYWQNKYHEQAIEMDDEDSRDIKCMFDNIEEIIDFFHYFNFLIIGSCVQIMLLLFIQITIITLCNCWHLSNPSNSSEK